MKYFYPLLENTLSKEDLFAGIKVIKSEQLTMSKKTKKFEKDFAKKLVLNMLLWSILDLQRIY